MMMFSFLRRTRDTYTGVAASALDTIATGTSLLPILPEFAEPLRAALIASGTDIAAGVHHVCSEPSLAASVLGLANRGRRLPFGRTADVHRVLTRIGPSGLHATLIELIEAHTWHPHTPQALSLLREHRADSLRIAHAAGHLAVRYGQQPSAIAHIAGLLHRIGALPLIVAADRARSAGEPVPELDVLLAERQDVTSHALLMALGAPRQLAQLPLQYAAPPRGGRVRLADLVAAARSLTRDVSDGIEFSDVRPLDRIGIARTEIGLQRREVVRLLAA